LFFGAQARDDNLDPSVIPLIRERGIVCVNICVDGFFEHLHVRKIARYFDLNWVTHYNALSISKYGAKVIYMPMAANPKFFLPKPNDKEKAIGFVGSNYGARSIYLEALKNAGLKIKVRGNGWLKNDVMGSKNVRSSTPLNKSVNLFLKLASFYSGRKIILSGMKRRVFKNRYSIKSLSDADIGPQVCLSETVDLYSSCMMSLGISEVHNTFVLKHPIYQYHLRDFECPMIGCAHLVRRSKELEECFEDGKEIIFYDSIEDCIDKARFYFQEKNEKELLEIGSSARIKSVKEHTWSKRFGKLCQNLGIKWE